MKLNIAQSTFTEGGDVSLYIAFIPADMSQTYI